ncbi:5' DNA nuclease [Rhizobiaceae bacterium n13]|uniref:5' DNA nuclease n=1 Tax=Ferirhizobium litorale TaxID=2927786 RepID=A0AAE3QJZ2_9HYPH|nr:5' DNA nuclease [Fererhizobium litorale]MDI7864360.1 5' DNA nuclease [Fererhizobium litorale]MDI7924726.1 5' DNA nuclease [Fererhizobium litorale]
MTAKTADKAAEVMTAIPAFDFGRFAVMPEYGTNGTMNPMMVNPAAAMAAAAAIGIGFTTQMTGAFFGALQGALAASQHFAGALEGEAAAVASQEPAIKATRAAPVVAKKPVVAEKHDAPVARKAKSPSRKSDDLKAISGIGPKLEKVLNEMGIRRFADIAGWSDEDVRRIDDELGFGGRILRDDWVGQAKVLGK